MFQNAMLRNGLRFSVLIESELQLAWKPAIGTRPGTSAGAFSSAMIFPPDVYDFETLAIMHRAFAAAWADVVAATKGKVVDRQRLRMTLSLSIQMALKSGERDPDCLTSTAI